MHRSEMKHDFGIFQQALCHIKCPQRGTDLCTDTGKVVEEHLGCGEQQPPACSKSHTG